MGWKASCVLINEREPGYLGTMPPHDPGRARRVIADLGLGPCRSRGRTTFDEGINPGRLVVGAYDGATVIGSPEFAQSFDPMGDGPLMARVLLAFPQAAVLRVGLHSVVNLWTYAYFEGGTLLRAYGGSADAGVVIDEGELLPEERSHFARSVVRDGERYFRPRDPGPEPEFDASAYGEELVFEVMGRFFGCRPDEGHRGINLFYLPMEAFEPEAPRVWWWPFRRVSFVEEAYRGQLGRQSCRICEARPSGAKLTPDGLCPVCSPLLDWFRGLYADEEELEPTLLTAETTFLNLAADSLDHVCWFIEAEERFGVVIPPATAERMVTVGDLLRSIQTNSEGGKLPSESSRRRPGGINPLWDREVDGCGVSVPEHRLLQAGAISMQAT